MNKNSVIAVLAATLATVFLSSPSQARPDHPVKIDRYVVRDDGGGSVDQFQRALDYIKANNMALKIDGYCASACTLVLDKNRSIDVCVTPKVKFGFHQPYAMDGLGRVHYTIPFIVEAEKIWKEDFYKKYPGWVQKKIDDAGGVPAVYKGRQPQDVLWMNYSDVSGFMKTCL